MPSDTEMESAFSQGDGDHDDGLSLSETSEALERLCGKSVDEKDIQEAAESLGVDIGSHELDVDEFKSVVKKLEEDGKL
ncbi:hypothetical protein BKA65DRAFT_502035 [Rhexocercosporidium sp. MPI-PUGE-AT-0058]|nr:hypothetical protein BKA65DRAFT_502035 [Rhexocercosporidium sp. MPI-PUGE-AT-0058]